MSYAEQSIARRLLDEDPDALGEVMRWTSAILTAPKFWALREERPDLLQEVLARVLQSLRQGRFDGSCDLRVYVQGIARFVSLKALGRRRRALRMEEPESQEAFSGPSHESRFIQRQLARRVLDLASRECRELMYLYFFEDRSYEEIAARLEVPSGTVKSRLFRCLQSVHQLLSRRGAPRLRRGAGANR